MSPKLTIGMAVFDDFDGVYFTVQAIRLYHKEVLSATELIVVDNNPTGQHGPHIKNFIEGVGGRYIPMPDATGTTQPRNRVFSEGKGSYILCCDSHVLIYPGALMNLLNWYANTGSKDLISGPMMYDRLDHGNTHFNNVWRAEMWGIWGGAFACSCSPKEEAAHFTILNASERADYRSLDMELTPRTKCPLCQKEYPAIPYPGHEKLLINAGFQQLGADDDGPIFPIPGNGLGLFSSRKDTWLGFNENFRGFGGEEMYIHEKYRKAGRQTLCLPFLKWGHRFARPTGVPYAKVLTRHNKIRNYVLGALEVGYPLDGIHKHFVIDAKVCPQWEWDFIVKQAIEAPSDPRQPRREDAPPHIQEQLAKTPPKPGLPQPRASADHAEIMVWARTTPRDLDKHLETIGRYALRCDHATEVTHRRESTIPLLYAKQKVVSYQSEADPLIPRLIDLFPTKLNVRMTQLSDPPKTIEETDLLFLDTVGTYDRLSMELLLYGKSVRKYIIVHDTALYSEKGEYPNSKGLLPALREFMRANPQWSVVFHTTDQYGLTVISQVASEREKLPSLVTMAANLAKASAAFVADGMKTVTKEQYNERLEICSMCEHRNEDRCALCGCGLSKKATGRAFECPIGKWPNIIPIR